MVSALRYNTGKAPLTYVLGLPKALTALARVFEQGAIKYAPDNWRKGGKPDQEYLDSATRHILKYVAGEKFDPETGAQHIAHAIWNLAVLIELNNADVPDRDPDFDQENFVNQWPKAEPKRDVKVAAPVRIPSPPWQVGDYVRRKRASVNGDDRTKGIVTNIVTSSKGYQVVDVLFDDRAGTMTKFGGDLEAAPRPVTLSDFDPYTVDL